MHQHLGKAFVASGLDFLFACWYATLVLSFRIYDNYSCKVAIFIGN